MDAIVTDQLSKTYGARRGPFPAGPTIRALDNVSIAVREGEIFGFLGPNGAGKSTMIRVLLGFVHPSAGSARVLGRDIVADGIEIRRRVGYLPGGIVLYDTMTGAALLDYLADLYGRPAPLRDDLLDRLELSGADLRRQVRDYSRGMRQKLGIVQALQHDPELSVLDEPTEGLDPLMQRAFYDILDERRAAGRTVFLSSHVLSEVERICDRVAIIRAGEIVALSDVTELLARRRRHVEIRLAGRPPVLDRTPGVTDVRFHDGVITCQLEGDVGPFLAALRRTAVSDLLIEPAHLEEAFLEFYADGTARGTDYGGPAAGRQGASGGTAAAPHSPDAPAATGSDGPAGTAPDAAVGTASDAPVGMAPDAAVGSASDVPAGTAWDAPAGDTGAR